jgi:sensor c-di-GMP phosphodiesterase-like protein
LQRTQYLSRLLVTAIAAGAVIGALTSGLVAWRNVNTRLHASAERAVQNAERLIDRTAADLQKVDALRSAACDSATVDRLKDAVYGATAHIREIGVIRDNTLFCTNFGPVTVDMRALSERLKPGVHIHVGPNAVVPNNSSLYVYMSRETGTAVNAVINPAVFAEYERGFAFTARGHLEFDFLDPLRPNFQTAAREMLYELGRTDLDRDVSAFQVSVGSKRFPLTANIRAERGVFWDEYWSIAPLLMGAMMALAAIVGLLLHRWLWQGGLDRSRYLAALKRGQFKVFYQPIVASHNHKIIGVEALVRWQHPKHGLLRAAQFAELFTDDVLAEPLARFVLAQVEKDFPLLRAEREDIWCSVNVPPVLLERTKLMKDITRHLQERTKDFLRLEMTERTPITEASSATLRELRAQGLRIGLDDIGTGYSNLSQLQKHTYDFIKIDGLLISSIQSADTVSPVVESLIHMAQKLGTVIVAEGVETMAQAQALSKRGVQQMQGYLFGPAKSIADIVEMLRVEKGRAVPSVLRSAA